MELAMAQPNKGIQRFQGFEAFKVHQTKEDCVVSTTVARATFKLNVDAPVFVPRSQNSFPAASFFYPCFPYLTRDGSGTDWVYNGDQENISSTINSNSNPKASSQQQSKNVLTEELQKKILKQMEYQFSDMSLLANDNLAKQTSKDPEGYVPISAVASTKKIKSLVGTNHQLLAQALRASAKLDVSSDGKKVKRKFPFTEKVKEDLQSRTIVAENLPDDHAHQNIEKIFRVAGSVKTIRICHPQDPTTRVKGDLIISTKLHALVEFETPESAEKAVELLHDQRDWRKGLRVRCLLRRSPKSVLKNKKPDFDGLVDDDDGLPAEISEAPSHCRTRPMNFETIASPTIEENSATSKKAWNKGCGRARQQHTQLTPVNLGRGVLASSPLLGSKSYSILGDASARQVTKGPRMPDGTRGFTMGRGRPLAAPPAALTCSTVV